MDRLREHITRLLQNSDFDLMPGEGEVNARLLREAVVRAAEQELNSQALSTYMFEAGFGNGYLQALRDLGVSEEEAMRGIEARGTTSADGERELTSLLSHPGIRAVRTIGSPP